MVPVGWWGKVKTATQLAALFLLLLSGAGAPAAARSAADTALQRTGVGLLYVMLFQMVTDVMQWIKLTGFFTLGLGVAFTALMPGSTTGDNHPFARALWLLVGDFDPQNLANAAWAFATAVQ